MGTNAMKADSDDVPPLEWRAHPARERPLAAIVAVGIIAALAGAVYAFSEQRIWAIIAAAVLCLAQSRFFFPTCYRLDTAGITQFTLFTQKSLAWDSIRRVEIGSLAAWLSPSRKRNWREGRRGVHVLFGCQRDEILRRIRAALLTHGKEGIWPAAARLSEAEEDAEDGGAQG
jgi:hypothetical protein